MMDMMYKISIWTKGGGRIYKEFPKNQNNKHNLEKTMEQFTRYISNASINDKPMSHIVVPGFVIDFHEVAGMELEGIDDYER